MSSDNCELRCRICDEVIAIGARFISDLLPNICAKCLENRIMELQKIFEIKRQGL